MTEKIDLKGIQEIPSLQNKVLFENIYFNKINDQDCLIVPVKLSKEIKLDYYNLDIEFINNVCDEIHRKYPDLKFTGKYDSSHFENDSKDETNLIFYFDK